MTDIAIVAGYLVCVVGLVLLAVWLLVRAAKRKVYGDIEDGRLVWTPVRGSDGRSFKATAMGRTYQVTERPEGGAFVKFFGDRFAWGGEDFKDIDEAKAAVQYEVDREARNRTGGQ